MASATAATSSTSTTNHAPPPPPPLPPHVATSYAAAAAATAAAAVTTPSSSYYHHQRMSSPSSSSSAYVTSSSLSLLWYSLTSLVYELGTSTEIVFNTRLTWMLVLGPLAVLADVLGGKDHAGGNTLGFCLAGLALIPCAERLSFVTEQVALHTNGTIGGLLNATFGNAPELLLSVAALRSGYYRVVQLAMIGSILCNLLFVFGVACLVGGLRWHVLKLRRISGAANIVLLYVAVAGCLFPAALRLSGQYANDASESTRISPQEVTFCRVNAAVLFFLYICFLIFQLGTHRQEFADDENENETTTANTNTNTNYDTRRNEEALAGGGGGGFQQSNTQQHRNRHNKRLRRRSADRRNQCCLSILRYIWKLRGAATSSSSSGGGTATLSSGSHSKQRSRFLVETTTTKTNNAGDNHDDLLDDPSEQESLPFIMSPHQSQSHHAFVDGGGEDDSSYYSDAVNSFPGMSSGGSRGGGGGGGGGGSLEMSSTHQRNNNNNNNKKELGAAATFPTTDTATTTVNSRHTEQKARRRRRRKQVGTTAAAKTMMMVTTGAAPIPSHLSETTFTDHKAKLSDRDNGSNNNNSSKNTHKNYWSSNDAGNDNHYNDDDFSLATSEELLQQQQQQQHDLELSWQKSNNCAKGESFADEHDADNDMDDNADDDEDDDDNDDDDEETPLLSLRMGLCWLLILTLCISSMSDILVDSIDDFALSMRLSEVFTSMVIVPFFSNVAEQVSAFIFAWRNEMDLCVAVTIGSAVQIATFVLPGSVLIGMTLDRSMTLYFGAYETVCVFFAVLVVGAILQAGSCTWLTGVVLVGIYIIFASGIWFHELENLTVDEETTMMATVSPGG